MNVIETFDEMDRNNDNVITYEEFRYYVGVVKGDTSLLTIQNFSHSLPAADLNRLEQYRGDWLEVAAQGQEKIEQQEAVELIQSLAAEPLSVPMVKALEAQMDVNGDGMIDYYEFARALDKIRSYNQ